MQFISEGSGADVKYYAQVGADSASKKLLGKSGAILLATDITSSRTINIKSLYPNEYADFTENNFIVQYVSTNVRLDITRDPAENNSATASGAVSKKYEVSTGMLTISISTITAVVYGNTDTLATATVRVNILLIK